MKEQMFRAHPMMIFKYLYPYLFVLLLPALRGLLNYGMNGALSQLVVGEILLAVLITTISVLKWRRYRLYLGSRSIRICEGFFFRTESVIPTDKLASFFVESRPSLWLFGGAYVRLNTEAGKPGKSDFELILSRGNLKELMNRLSSSGTKVKQYDPPAVKVILMAAATSSSAAGLLIAAPVINKAGQLLGRGFSDMVYGTIEQAASWLELIIPPVASTLSILFLIGFGISFVISIFKNAPFRLYIDGERFTAVSGLIARRETSFMLGSINNVIIEQTLLMRLLHHYSVKVCVAGYGNRRGETAVVIPAANKRQTARLIGEILSQQEEKPFALRSPVRAFSRFIVSPLLLLAAIPGAAFALSNTFPEFRSFIQFVAVILAVVVVLLISVNLRRYAQGGVTFGDHIRAYSTKRMTLTELRCSNNRTGIIRVTQNPFDRQMRLCRVRITVRSESANTLNVSHLDYPQVAKALSDYYHVDLAKPVQKS